MNKKNLLLTITGIIASGLVYYTGVWSFSSNEQTAGQQQKLLASHNKQENRQKPVMAAAQTPDADDYFASKRLARGMSVPTHHYTEAIRHKRQFINGQSVFAAQPWQSLGPEQVGGRTRSLVFHPADPNILFAGGVSGGVWKSIDSGASWVAVSDDIENLAVVTLAILPGSPNVILAGTGEGVYVGRPIVRSRGVEGNGIYRSMDNGQTWQALTATLDNSDFRFVNKIRAAQDGTLFAATEKGLWRSLDTGDTWQQVLDQSNRVGGCNEIEIQPSSNPNRILASCGSFDTAAVYLSVDNGDAWQVVIEETFQGRTTLAFAPSNPNRVYALSAQNQHGPYPYGLNGLYRSDDGGTNWSLVASTDSVNPNSRAMLSTTNYVFDCSNTGEYQDGRLFGGGWYYNLLVVDPTDENRIWTGGLDLWRSDDAGVNFKLASFWWADEGQPSYIHADHHLLVYHPDYDGSTETRLFATNDGGLWQTQNPNDALASHNCQPSSSLVDWQSLNNNYAVTQFYHGSVARDGKTLIGGSQDNGTQWRAENGQWQRINGGDGSYSAINPLDSSIVYVSSQYAYLKRLQLSDSGNQETFIGGAFDAPGLFITPFILDPNNSQRLWLAGLALWRSDNEGQTWAKVSRDEYEMNYIDGLSALAAQPGNSNLMLLGGTDGYIYRHSSALTGNDSLVMEKIKIADGYISSINFDRNNPNKVVASVSTFGQLHAWLSNDAGLSWQAIDVAGSEGLPDLPAHDILVAPHDSNTLYVATDIGVYISENNGLSWQPLTSGLPNVPVEKLIYNRFDLQSRLFAFTYGRGVFQSVLTDIINYAPVANVASSTVGGVRGDPLSLNLNNYFSDQNDDLLSFTASGLPAGLTLSNSGVISGNTTTAGTTTTTVTASDGELSATIDLAFSILESDDGPSTSRGGGSLFFVNMLLILSLLKRRFHH